MGAPITTGRDSEEGEPGVIGRTWTFVANGIAALVLMNVFACRGAPQLPEPGAATPSTVRVAEGTLRGRETDGISSFKGIPFARPPVGALRWRAPQPPEPWQGVRDATLFEPACPQFPLLLTAAEIGPMDEDCLQLNVWTPSLGSGGMLPVMVWIHGGGHRIGHAPHSLFDGTNLARKGVVLVSVNYRLGRLGFFAHPAMIEEAGRLGEPTGNYGIMDQIAALEWVKANIAVFGGNPDRVTIFGESGGGRSVNWLMTSPLSEGLFEGAISQSGRALQPLRHITEERMGLEPMSGIDARVIARLGVEPTLEALRALPIDTIVVSYQEMERDGFGPFIDGEVIPDDPGLIFAAGGQHDVPFIIGSNSFEASMSAARLSAEELLGSAEAVLGDAYKEADQLYGFSNPAKDPNEWSTIDFIQDSVHLSSSRFLARGMSNAEAPGWLYHFEYLAGFRRPNQPRGAHHGAEMKYVFDNLHYATDAGRYDENDQRIADMVSDYWVSFALDGDPNAPHLPNWPVHDPEDDQLLHIGDEVKAVADFRKPYLDFNERVYRNLMGLPPMAE